MKTTGRHLLVEYRRCNCDILNDRDRIEQLMKSAAVVARATVVGSVFRTFNPQGVSGVVVIEESHLSIHTWPEYGYAAVDFYTCGDCLPEAAHQFLQENLEASEAEIMSIDRGQLPPARSIRIASHHTVKDGTTESPVAREKPVMAGL